jgi:hypothetical protein
MVSSKVTLMYILPSGDMRDRYRSWSARGKTRFVFAG